VKRCYKCGTEINNDDVISTDRDGYRVFQCAKCGFKQ